MTHTVVERVSSFKSLEDVSWSIHMASVVSKAQQCLFYQKKLMGYQILKPLLVNFHICAIRGQVGTPACDDNSSENPWDASTRD